MPPKRSSTPAINKKAATNLLRELEEHYVKWRACSLEHRSRPTPVTEKQLSAAWDNLKVYQGLLSDMGMSVTDDELRTRGTLAFTRLLEFAGQVASSRSPGVQASKPEEEKFEFARFKNPEPPAPAPSPVVPVADKPRLKYSFEYFARRAIFIPYRAGMQKGQVDKFGPLLLNSAQRKVIAVMVYLYFVKKVPLRVIILKARQLGCTTLVLAFAFFIAVTVGDFRILTIIDKDDHVISKRQMLLDWYEHLEERIGDEWIAEGNGPLPFITSRAGQNIYTSNRSVFLFESARSDNPGTSEMLTGLLQSEKPKWKNGVAAKVRDSVAPGIPNQPYTMIVDESTALGLEAFYDSWSEATGPHATDLSPVPIFIGWFLSDEYSSPAPADFKYSADPELGDDDPSSGLKITEEEYAYKYNLTRDQIFWRRNQILTVFKSRAAFDQEYPTTPKHAFRKVAANYFPTNLLLQLSAVKPLAVGELFDRKSGPARIGLQYTDVLPAFRELNNGMLSIWEHPQPGLRYFAGGDVATGKASLNNEGDYDPDFSVVPIIREDGYLVAQFRAHIRTEDLWYPLLLLCVYYNNAYVCFDRDPYTEVLALNWWLTGYINNYITPAPENSKRLMKDRMWLDVTQANRNAILDDLRRSWVQVPGRVVDAVTIDEAGHFVVNPNTGKVAAQSGYHDDTILARAQAEFIRLHCIGRAQAETHGLRVVEARSDTASVPKVSTEMTLDQIVGILEDPNYSKKRGPTYGW